MRPYTVVRCSCRWQLKQALVFVMHGLVTLAGAGFEAADIGYGNQATTVFDQAGLLQLASGLGDRFAPQAQQIGQLFLGRDNLVFRQAFQAEQQPPA